MTDEPKQKEIARIYKRCQYVAGKFGREHDGQDFAAWFVIRILEGKSQHQTCNLGFIDYLRETYGVPGSARNLFKHSTESHYTQLEDIRETHGDADSGESDRDPRLDRLNRIRDGLPWAWRAAIDMAADGRTLRSIGDTLGLTESRICQIFRQLRHFRVPRDQGGAPRRKHLVILEALGFSALEAAALEHHLE